MADHAQRKLCSLRSAASTESASVSSAATGVQMRAQRFAASGISSWAVNAARSPGTRKMQSVPCQADPLRTAPVGVGMLQTAFIVRYLADFKSRRLQRPTVSSTETTVQNGMRPPSSAKTASAAQTSTTRSSMLLRSNFKRMAAKKPSARTSRHRMACRIMKMSISAENRDRCVVGAVKTPAASTSSTAEASVSRQQSRSRRRSESGLQ